MELGVHLDRRSGCRGSSGRGPPRPSRRADPCHQRHRGAVLDHRRDGRTPRRGGLVVEVDLTALDGQVHRAAALESERLDVRPDQVERDQGRQVQSGGADPPEAQRRLPVDELGRDLHPGRGAGVNHATGAVREHRGEGAEVVGDLGPLQDPRHDARRSADQHLRAVRLRRCDEAVGADDALAAGVVDRREARLAGYGVGEALADEARPRVGPSAFGERDDDLHGLPREVAVTGGGCAVQQATAERGRGQREHQEDRHQCDGDRRVGGGGSTSSGAGPERSSVLVIAIPLLVVVTDIVWHGSGRRQGRGPGFEREPGSGSGRSASAMRRAVRSRRRRDAVLDRKRVSTSPAGVRRRSTGDG